MAVVRSGWASSPIFVTGTFNPGEWTGAGTLPIPAGHLLVKNDDKYLYLALDLVGDTGNSPGVGDYFWLSFDVDGNRGITPHVDVNYGIYPTLPIRIGRQYYLGPGTWTGLQPGPSTSLARQGFAASPYSPTPHRIWEMRIDFAEIAASLSGSGGLTPLRFGLRVASSSPSFVYDYPSGFYTSFNNLHEIWLALGPEGAYPPGTAGVVIGGVGLIPATVIAGGRATTAAGYVPHVQNAAFGGTMNLIGNRVTMQSLWTAGARKYRVLHREGVAGAFAPIRQSWSNYRWTGTTYVLESYGPDADNKYDMLNPSLDYSIDDLLFQWKSGGFVAGIHEFQAQFFNAGGGAVPSPPQTLQLFLDNNLPQVQILGLRYRGTDISPCAIVQILETPDPVQVHIRAFDPEGDLLRYALNAHYGADQVFSPPLASAGYPGGNWQGVSDLWVSAPVAPNKFPPITCAYQLRLSAWPRVTNGYGYIGYTEATDHVTFIRAGAAPVPIIRFRGEFPFGFAGAEHTIQPGKESGKLGG